MYLTVCRAFQTALELSERGKHEDDSRNYPAALPLYELALDYYLRAHKCTFAISFSNSCNLLFFFPPRLLKWSQTQK